MITYALDPIDSDGPVPSADGHPCFFCGAGLLDPTICWLSQDSEAIFFHPSCLVEAIPALFDEAIEQL